MSCFLFCLFTRFELATRGSKCEAFGRNSPGDCFAASALYLCADYAFLPVEQPECPAPFFVYLQDLNLRHEAPNAKHLAETVRGTVSQQVPYISVPITYFCRWSSRNVLLLFLFIYKIWTCDTRLQMRSIWQKQSGGLFRSECLIFL